MFFTVFYFSNYAVVAWIVADQKFFSIHPSEPSKFPSIRNRNFRPSIRKSGKIFEKIAPKSHNLEPFFDNFSKNRPILDQNCL